MTHKWTISATVALLLVLGSLAVAEMQTTDLRCEYLQDPMGIDPLQPRLSWVLESPERGQKQTAYRVLVAGSPEELAKDVGDLWDSGKVASDQSIHVVYTGKPLESGMRCWWKVRVWDAHGQESAWSRPARWTMGLLDESDWKGQWIGLDEPPAEAQDNKLKQSQWIWFPEGNPAAGAPIATRYFRRQVMIPQGRQIVQATCFFSADNEFVLFVNGHQCGKGANFHLAAPIDVSEHLGAGPNILAVSAVNGGETENPAGLVGALHVEFAEGEPLLLVTDQQWLASTQKEPGWDGLEFDDSGWVPAQKLGDHGMDPWGEVSTSGDHRRLSARMLRREFQLDKKVKQATAFISGLGYYELYLNGRKVGDHVLDPALSEYSKRVFYVTYDATGQLQQGANAVGVILGNGRYYAPRTSEPTPTRTFGFPKLLLQMHVVYDDGTTENIVTDDGWKLTTEGPLLANNDYDGEEYDARREQPGWNTPGFDDSAWQKAQQVDPPGGKLAAQMIEPMRVTQKIQPIAISNPKPGIHVFDMGQNMVGFCRLKVSGSRGTKVSLKHAEVLRDDGTLFMDNIRGAKVTDVYLLKGEGLETYEPRFTYHGFRYVAVRGYPGEPELSAIEGQVVHTDVRTAGEFACSNTLINRLHRNIVWGMRGNYLSIPTDCPQRDERQGWQGDRAAESKGESYLFHIARLYDKWLDDIQDSQKPDGNLSDVCPPYWPLYSANVTWPSAYTIIPGTLHTQYADRRAIERHYETMKKWMDFMGQFISDDIIDRDNYGDWCVPPEDPSLIHSLDPGRKTAKAVLATTYYYNNLRLMAGYAVLLEKPDDAKQFNAAADRMREAFNQKFFNPQTNLYDNGTQTSSVLPLFFGMVPDGHRQQVFNNLIENIEVKTNGHIGTGLIGGQWLMRTLSDNGRTDVAYRLATNKTYPSWGYMIENDATTIWELWNGNTADPAMNSHNHVMLVGDLVIWFYEGLAGIKSDHKQPGFKHIIMRPRPVGDLRFVKAVHRSPYGTIASDWKIEDGTFRWDMAVPVNTTATVYVPTSDPNAVRQRDTAADKAQGVKFLRAEDGAAVFRVESGSYAFSAPYTMQ